jgi:hypothetical protein
VARLQEELQQKPNMTNPSDMEPLKHEKQETEVKEERVVEKQMEELEEKAAEEKEKGEDEGQESEISPSKKGKSRGKRAAPDVGDASKSVSYIFFYLYRKGQSLLTSECEVLPRSLERRLIHENQFG